MPVHHTDSTPTPPRHWTVLAMIQWATTYLVERGFDEARLHVEYLLAHVLRSKRLDLYLQFDRPLTSGELLAFKALFKRRLAHEPLQYIIGEADFMGLSISVDQRVLIPRPETELLVEAAVDFLQGREQGTFEVLDIGTGSGNLSLAIGRRFPTATITSLDVSDAALAVAAANLRRHGVTNVQLRQADIFADTAIPGVYDLVVSNPPYVSRIEFDSLQQEVRDFEPRNAVTDNADGLSFARRIASLCREHLKSGGCLLLEIGHGQEEGARGILEGAGLVSCSVTKDYAGIPRCMRAFHP